MANHLDLEEQEQLDQLKHFWKQYGNLISWLLIAVLSAFAGWNGYQYWQRNQSVQAAAMMEEVERAAQGADLVKLDRAFADMKQRFESTAYAAQAGLLVAKVNQEMGKLDAAKSVLAWVVAHTSDQGYQTIARLRLAGVLMETKAFDEALAQLKSSGVKPFDALMADRRGDIYAMQGNKVQAVVHYQDAYKAMDERLDYRRLVEVKLNALGVDPRSMPVQPVEKSARAAVPEGTK